MYTAANYDHLIGMQGFSETLLRNHFALYQGYVTNTNKMAEILQGMAREGRFGPEYAELRRRFAWEWNGMRLHEMYFNNLGGKAPLDEGSVVFKTIAAHFGSFEEWKREFQAIGAMRGIGWVILYYDACGERLFNQWVNEHDVGHFAGARPILVMDVFEHAYMTDYGLRRADYIQAFFNNINWDKVTERLSR